MAIGAWSDLWHMIVTGVNANGWSVGLVTIGMYLIFWLCHLLISIKKFHHAPRAKKVGIVTGSMRRALDMLVVALTIIVTVMGHSMGQPGAGAEGYLIALLIAVLVVSLVALVLLALFDEESAMLGIWLPNGVASTALFMTICVECVSR